MTGAPKKRGRPPVEHPRDTTIEVRVSAPERAVLTDAARRLCVSVSALMRMAGLDRARRVAR